MSHEQSETVEIDGKWYNVYGKATPKAGQVLPGTGAFNSQEEAVAAAKMRSEMLGKLPRPDPRGRAPADNFLDPLEPELRTPSPGIPLPRPDPRALLELGPFGDEMMPNRASGQWMRHFYNSANDVAPSTWLRDLPRARQVQSEENLPGAIHPLEILRRLGFDVGPSMGDAAALDPQQMMELKNINRGRVLYEGQ